jgi:Tfp pilus assembly protein PilV
MHLQQQLKDSRSAYSLVEAMVGIFLFTMVAAGIVQLLTLGYKTMASAQDRVRATQIIQYQIETLRSTPWDSISASAGSTTIAVDQYGIPTTGAPEIPFTWSQFSFNQTLTMTETDYCDATFTLKWTDAQVKEHTQTFQTAFTKNGLNAYYTRTTN